MALTTNPSPCTLNRAAVGLLVALSLALAVLVASFLFLLAASVAGNPTASGYLTAVVTWLTGGMWGQIALYALLVAVPSPLGRDVLALLKGGSSAPLARDVTPLVNQEARALNLPIQVDASQAEAALNHLLGALLDAHSSTDSLAAKLVDAADKAAHASLLTLPPMQPIDTSALRQMTASSNETPPAAPEPVLAPAGPLSSPR